jgi:hypothetical protein
MVERVGAVPVMSDISNFIKKFNTGEVDVVAAPAYAYKPLFKTYLNLLTWV